MHSIRRYFHLISNKKCLPSVSQVSPNFIFLKSVSQFYEAHVVVIIAAPPLRLYEDADALGIQIDWPTCRLAAFIDGFAAVLLRIFFLNKHSKNKACKLIRPDFCTKDLGE
jgi:hypothetical protein